MRRVGQNAAPALRVETPGQEFSPLTEIASTPSIREVVGIFSTPEPLEKAIKELLADGFAHADLSVLASHEAIEAASGVDWTERLMPLLTEMRYEVPLVTGALIAVATGPIGAAVAALTAAGVGAAALNELFNEIVSLPDTEEFAEAVRAGEIVLWAVVADASKEAAARATMERLGARNVHIHARSVATA